MTLLTVQNAALAGLDTTLNTPSGGGDTFYNDGATLLVIKNANASTCNLTITTQHTSVTPPGFGTLTLADATVAVPTTKTYTIGPFGTARFNDASNLVHISTDVQSSVTVAVVRMTPAT